MCSRCWVGCDNCLISARIRQLDPPPLAPVASSKGIGTQRIRNQHQASNHSNPTGGWAALSGGVLAWWVPQSGAHCAYQPKQRPCGVPCPSSYAHLSCLPADSDTTHRPGAAAASPSANGHEPRVPCAAGGRDWTNNKQQTFNFNVVTRRKTPCSGDAPVGRAG